jgi:hypothetical protein
VTALILLTAFIIVFIGVRESKDLKGINNIRNATKILSNLQKGFLHKNDAE